jgi:hypothetical protein
MRGLLRRLVEVEQTIIITELLVIRIAIPITADGSSGTVDIGWVGVCQI